MDCANNCSSCISDIIKKILILQKKDIDCDNYIGCDKPFLGPTIPITTYNTRPIILYVSGTGSPWTFDYTLDDGTTSSSNVLRVEYLDECCCTCRILYPTDGGYSSTNQFVTIDLESCGAIRCLPDTNIEL